ncbi:uncharacterized protein IWZ02DRAFT_441042 [Phyllosticta citriasiana]|uniref:Uncharacterized protein n=1 Tax=Phyllosticta citriasiana TaxID=595635 RepID=A0ABR1KVU2_9PEZI
MSTTTFEALASSASDVPAAAAAAAAPSRKRSRATMMLLHDDDDHGQDEGGRHHHHQSINKQEISSINAAAAASKGSSPSPLLRRPSTDRKRPRASGVLDGLELMPAAAAWQLNMDEMLDGVVLSDWHPANQQEVEYSGSSKSIPEVCRYVPRQSVVVLCVVESTDVHLRLLCAHLPHLLTTHPTLSLYPILLTRHAPSALRTSTPSLPATIPAKGTPANHFLRLGLLHPLGGGLAAMDALVLLDHRARRRLVVPFGWGVGRAAVAAGGAESGACAVRERLMEALEEGVVGLEREREAEEEEEGRGEGMP